MIRLHPCKGKRTTFTRGTAQSLGLTYSDVRLFLSGAMRGEIHNRKEWDDRDSLVHLVHTSAQATKDIIHRRHLDRLSAT